MRVQRHAHGSVRFDKRRKTWNFLWYESGKRRSKLIGTKQEFPTKTAVWEEVEHRGIGQHKHVEAGSITLKSLVERYRVERMPKRVDTKRSYEVWISNHNADDLHYELFESLTDSEWEYNFTGITSCIRERVCRSDHFLS